MIRVWFFNPLALLLIFLALPLIANATDDCGFALPATVASPAIPDGFGVNIEFTDARPGEMKLLAAAGFRWVRVDLKWDATERVKGQYDFAAYDRLMSVLDQYGLRALFILDYGNPAYDEGQPPRTVASRQAFARWAVAAAKHFAGRGVIWETYNEPNIAQFWPPAPNVADYVALAQTVGRAFRANVPGEQLIGPATSGIDFVFLETCFKGDLLDYWSAVSVHPYRRSDPETAVSDYCRLRKLIDHYAPAGKTIPIISSEWGYSSAWTGVDDRKQSELLARSWLTNAVNNISVSIWYDWHDDGADAAEPEHHFGTVYHPYREGRQTVFDPKPAYRAARTLTSFFRGYRFARRLPVSSPDDYVIVFRKGAEVRVAAWTTNSRAHAAVIPLAAAQYSAISHTGQNVGTISASSKGLSLTLTTSPVYLSQSRQR